MENQENKKRDKNNHQHSHHHQSHAGHHAGHGCCSEKDDCCEESAEQCCGAGKGKCCGPFKNECCAVTACSCGHKAAKLVLGLIIMAALFLIGFSCGARLSYNHNKGFERYGIMEKKSGGCPFTDDVRQRGCSGGCQGTVGLNTPEVGGGIPAPDTITEPQAPIE